MQPYLQVFVNFEYNNSAKLLSMAKFAYINAKNASTSHTPFKLNYNYYLYVFFKENTNFCSQSKTTDKLSTKLQELMTVCRENLYHTQEL